MNTSRFLKQLLEELPRWQERGWITPENGSAIVEDLRARDSGTRHIAYAVAILGVLLLGAGIITWFAANWQEIGKLGKLLILLGALYLAYGIAGYLLHEERYPRIGQAMLLLGVILFGANIMLIAQMYHIDSHFPDGLLMWALGGLATAYLLKNEPAFVATIALSLLWSGSESGGFNHVHPWYLLFWIALLPAVVLWRWQRSFVVALAALFVWSVITFFVIDVPQGIGARLYVVQLYFLLYAALFIVGLLLDTWWPAVRYASAVQNTGVVGTLVSGYFLTFPNLQSGNFGWNEGVFRAPADDFWVALNLLAVLLVVALSLAHYWRTRAFQSMRFLLYGRGVMGLAILMLIISLFVDGVHGGPIAIVLNVLYFGGLAWLVFAGMKMGVRALVNLGFLFFAVTLLTRYFDTFWTLMNRSLFFMVGGVILIAGGYLLERQRRRITGEMGGGDAGGVS